MSAALTMPGLFPLVGIAGKDDREAFALATQNVDPGPKNGPPEKKNGSHGSTAPAQTKGFQGPRKGANGAFVIRPAILTPRIAASANVTLMARMRSRLVGRAM